MGQPRPDLPVASRILAQHSDDGVPCDGASCGGRVETAVPDSDELTASAPRSVIPPDPAIRTPEDAIALRDAGVSLSGHGIGSVGRGWMEDLAGHLIYRAPR
jgi:hypothetical protein